MVRAVKQTVIVQSGGGVEPASDAGLAVSQFLPLFDG